MAGFLPGGQKVKTYVHSLVGLSIGLIVIYFTLNFLRTRGPMIAQGPAGTLGDLISGQRFNF